MKGLCNIFLSAMMLSACNSDIESQRAFDFVSQLRLGMTVDEYSVLRASSYPLPYEGMMIGSACAQQGDGNQSCSAILLGPVGVFTLAYTYEELTADCAKFACYPRNLADILSYDPNTGMSDEMADGVVLRMMNWGSWKGRRTAYIFADPTKQHLVGLMLEGDFEGITIQFPE